jgi:hypothetical protein
MAAALVDGPDGPRAAVFGGLGLADVQVYDAATDRWSSPGALEAPRASAEVVTLGCAVVVCGGLIGPGDALEPTATCEALTHDGGFVVSTAATLPAPTFSFTFTALDDSSALVTGGSGDDAPLGTAVVLSLGG